MQTIAEKLGIQEEVWKRLLDNAVAELHVCNPGIVQSFNSQKQTVTVILAIKEKVMQNDYTVKDTAFPLLVDVPISVPRAGGFCLTLPIKKGDECLVIFSDLGIDWWYQNGGTQVKTQDLRRHDLSDGFAIMGVWSQPKVIANYNTTSAQLRNDAGTAYIEITNDAKLNFKGVTTFLDEVTFDKAVTFEKPVTFNDIFTDKNGIEHTEHKHAYTDNGNPMITEIPQ
jgi:hypothetical protein